MAEAKKIDPYDVEALQKSLNDSATRVSTIWVSYLVFGLYLVIAAGNVTQRQLFVEEPIKLPVLNIDLPLVGFFFLAPALFVVYHAYVLIQVVLLARTAEEYNHALQHVLSNEGYRSRVRQRLANTLFAQIFAGSPRERKGFFGIVLRFIATLTLVLAPALLLLLFQVKFLPYHHPFVTWAHRGMVATNLVAVFLLWPLATHPSVDYSWQVFNNWKSKVLTIGGGALSLLLVVFSFFAVSFPGEGHARLTRNSDADRVVFYFRFSHECARESLFQGFLPASFDRLYLPNIDLVDDTRLAQLERTTAEKGLNAYQGERTRTFNMRDLSCSDLSNGDLRRSDFTGADLHGSSLNGAELQGAIFSGANLRDADLGAAKLHESLLSYVDLRRADLSGAELYGASLVDAELQDADLTAAKLWGAYLSSAQLQGATLDSAELLGSELSRAVFHGASLQGAKLNGSRLNRTEFQGSDLSSADLRGTVWHDAQLQGADFEDAKIAMVVMTRPFVWNACNVSCNGARIISPNFEAVVRMKYEYTDDGSEKPDPVLGSTDSIRAFSAETFSQNRDPQKLQENMERSLPLEPPAGTTEHPWEVCLRPSSTDDHYETRLVGYLAQLGCAERPYQHYITSGIKLAWTNSESLSKESTQRLARALLGLEKRCPGAEGLKKIDIQQLRSLAEGDAESR